MNRNDLSFQAEKIRAQYEKKENTEMDALRALDAKVKRPVNVFSYVFGSISAIVMGAGMSLVMTEVGAAVGIASAMPIGIAIGVVGLALALINYPLNKAMIRSRKKRFAPQIMELSEKILAKENQ